MLPLGGRLFDSLIITQIGRENNISAENYVSRTVGDAGPYNFVNILMRRSVKRGVFCRVKPCANQRELLNFSCGQLYKVVYIVGLNLGFVRCFVAVYFAAFCAFVQNDVSLFRVGHDLYGVHYAVAFAGSVAGVYVYVERAEALRAVVARGIAEGLYLEAAVCTDKTVIVFCEKFLFHYAFLYSKSHLGVAF